MQHSQRGFMGFLLLVIIGAAAAYFYFYAKGPNGKPLIQEQLDAMGQAKQVQQAENKHNLEIDAALKEY